MIQSGRHLLRAHAAWSTGRRPARQGQNRESEVSVELQREAQRHADRFQLLAADVADTFTHPGEVHRGGLFNQDLGRLAADGDRRAEVAVERTSTSARRRWWRAVGRRTAALLRSGHPAVRYRGRRGVRGDDGRHQSPCCKGHLVVHGCKFPLDGSPHGCSNVTAEEPPGDLSRTGRGTCRGLAEEPAEGRPSNRS